MTYEQYVTAQRAVVAALVSVLLVLLAAFQFTGLGRRGWLSLLAALYPHVEQARRQSAELARLFYDAERRRHVGTDDHPIYLAGYEPAWFEEAMRPERARLSRTDTTDGDIARAVSRAVKEVENGGRRTLLRAVESDPQVKGWARVAGGNESCAFCTMLISRGPVYLEAETAGLDADDVSAVELWRQIEHAQTPQQRARAEAAMDELMTRWHPNCDCKVVPVFNRSDWPGRDAYRQAERLWKDTTKGLTGRDALNALRRALHGQSGDPADDIAA
ncbi:hypothetical protein [Amycolatopsis cihanbeyliensis]|uniref:Uncharacterized protein n=1 Tax=Amycolatopsis cihanbeyliensis TaxID=1128664 RepID=A0A542DNQ1_AMYCI|nr:hypothetical protein [Amycolatopsis cihanbeyliensis]TQJ04687.1 hypothetical protein FB471_4494 [Amycolatopsis cihanbeyliensis]